MIRVRLFGTLTLIRDKEIEEKLERLFEPHTDDDPKDVAPYRSFVPVSTNGLKDTVPGMIEAVMKEHEILNGMGLPAEEVIIWGGNKVRANPGSKYRDPRDPDSWTKF
ncbi:hypothetical protein LCGC14_1018280 [marine sediment metagenome]|uniref:Uncharacterized protein n=1 Tax=marine sediment metagenome TaxID=412755 RepID=A0A0F9MY40_9ZZZZ